MNIIREASKSLMTLLAPQEIDTNKEYRKIAFCVLEFVDGIAVAYNSLTGEVLELDNDEAGVLKQERIIPSELSKELIKKWFLVPATHNDIQLCDELRDFLKQFKKSEGLSQFTVFTTMDCNARCFYCYELGRPRVRMNEETAQKAADFILEHCNNKKVHITWFGGEPLYNYKVIDIIVDRLISAGIEYSSNIISNGLLFEQELIDKAVNKWHIGSAQITIDGTEDVYNRTKAYINCEGKNPFVIVTDNIEVLLKNGVKVVVRMNFGLHNSEDLFNLVDWLAERYKGYDDFSVYAQILFEETSRGIMSTELQWKMAAGILALEERCMANGIYKLKELDKSIRLSQCMADSDSAITITPLGFIGKCEHFSDDEYVGTLSEGITDKERVLDFKIPANCTELCSGCSAYPLCIQLKKCPDAGLASCTLIKRHIAETKLKRRLKYTYRKLKESK